MKRRKISASVLLAVFLPMLLLTSLHVHHEQLSQEFACVECTHHMPHAGHLTAAQASFDDCLLCQICHVPVLIAAVVVLTLNLHLLHTLRGECRQQLAMRPEGIRLSRAPPFI